LKVQWLQGSATLQKFVTLVKLHYRLWFDFGNVTTSKKLMCAKMFKTSGLPLFYPKLDGQD